MSLADDPGVAQLIELARREDLGTGDVTSALLPDAKKDARFQLTARQQGVFAGAEIASAVLKAYDPGIRIRWSEAGRDGEEIRSSPVTLATLEGPLDALLAAERVLLNFLQRLCGIATLTWEFVEAVAGTGAKIYDTRKTVPGWRLLDKYAVRCGGGRNHRFGLYDAVLTKDNHIHGQATRPLAGVIFEMFNSLGPERDHLSFVAVEARDVEDVEELMKVVGVDVIVLDNFFVSDLRRAVAIRDKLGLRGKVALEASGGIGLDNVRAVAQTGVERISVGALTHSAPALDLALERV